MKIFTDAGSRGNPGPSAFAVVICSETGEKILEFSRFLGERTNNEAEYHGLLAALEEAKKMGADEVEIISDSELMIKQLTGKYRIKSENLLPLAKRAKDLMGEFKSVELSHSRRDHPLIRKADRLVNEELDAMQFARRLRS